MQEEEKNTDIRELLRKLPLVKASDDFEERLFDKISQIESSETIKDKIAKKNQPGFFEKLFGSRRNPWLAPALGFTVVAVFALYITLINRDKAGMDFKQNMPDTETKIEDKNKNTIIEETKTPSIPESRESKKPADLKNELNNVQAPAEKKTVEEKNEANIKSSKLKPEIKFENDNPVPMSAPDVITGDNRESEKKIEKTTDEESMKNNSEIMSAPALKTGESNDGKTIEDRAALKSKDKVSINKLDSLNKINLEKLRDKLKDN